MTPFAAEWASYRRVVVPASAPLVQVQECQRAFYAGARALLHLMETRVLDADHTEVTDGEVDRLEQLEAEVLAFAETVRATH